jgi:hypothetical protein
MQQCLNYAMRRVDPDRDTVPAPDFPVGQVRQNELKSLLVDLFDRDALTVAVYDPDQRATADEELAFGGK